ncbi:unnamed protein product [Aphanomyces euteiches]|uniref:DUF4219 domain-containing protein n=1 Tax=Aphanomyces euteiches TaxID=100861 RepID=A0A6G0WAJ8_9STRA|nr:hypothetical protein Ae201684_017021 [Aphanomyces euteiches]KAH9078431.1 hypothetical protein Ae201684P_019518 [Aphanomyces euteiches]KAH9133536.1 hypothetical protein AeRB84_020402 [Aphanomyces euteiches]
MSAASVIKLSEHNYHEWREYFAGRLMAKRLHELLTAPVTAENASNDQKAFGILIETLDPNQYQYLDVFANVKAAYEALVAHYQPIAKIDRIGVAMEWAKINWNLRQETLPDFFLRFSLLIKRLAGFGAAETGSNIVFKLLALMPWDFRHLVDRLSHAPSSEETLPLVKLALEAEWKAALRNGVMKRSSGQLNEERALNAVGKRLKGMV